MRVDVRDVICRDPATLRTYEGPVLDITLSRMKKFEAEMQLAARHIAHTYETFLGLTAEGEPVTVMFETMMNLVTNHLNQIDP